MKALALGLPLLLAPAALAGDERPEPVVVGFSPLASPQGMAYVDGRLTVGVTPGDEGRIVVRLRAAGATDARTPDERVRDLADLAGRVRVTRFVPGIGEEVVGMRAVDADGDRIRLTPRTLPLADGRYAVAVLLASRPVFHAFTVGSAAPVAPVVTDARVPLRASLEALRDEVRALRNEIRELRALVERSSPSGR
jgi:hypothetical protein